MLSLQANVITNVLLFGSKETFDKARNYFAYDPTITIYTMTNLMNKAILPQPNENLVERIFVYMDAVGIDINDFFASYLVSAPGQVILCETFMNKKAHFNFMSVALNKNIYSHLDMKIYSQPPRTVIERYNIDTVKYFVRLFAHQYFGSCWRLSASNFAYYIENNFMTPSLVEQIQLKAIRENDWAIMIACKCYCERNGNT